ncbi:hypothetical protein GCM10027612_29460 [Microbispora bryophytorum subsp. camponoti]
MQTDSALALAVVLSGEEPLGWRRLQGRAAVSRLGTVDLDAPPEILAGEISQMRIFAGYAGWTAGQLDNELQEGAWYVVDSDPGDTFHPNPDTLWRTVLRRQKGTSHWSPPSPTTLCSTDPAQLIPGTPRPGRAVMTRGDACDRR